MTESPTPAHPDTIEESDHPFIELIEWVHSVEERLKDSIVQENPTYLMNQGGLTARLILIKDRLLRFHEKRRLDESYSGNYFLDCHPNCEAIGSRTRVKRHPQIYLVLPLATGSLALIKKALAVASGDPAGTEPYLFRAMEPLTEVTFPSSFSSSCIFNVERRNHQTFSLSLCVGEPYYRSPLLDN